MVYTKVTGSFGRVVRRTPGYDVHTSIRDAGWINPNISLEDGVGVMLQKGWPELYEKVLDKEMSPFRRHYWKPAMSIQKTYA